MEVVTAEDYDGMSKEAAKFIYEAIEKNPNITLGLATGSTPQKMYQYLAEMLNENNINLSNVHTVNLDEYVGLDADNAQSYHYLDRKSTRLNSSHVAISYAVFCLKKKIREAAHL